MHLLMPHIIINDNARVMNNNFPSLPSTAQLTQGE